MAEMALKYREENGLLYPIIGRPDQEEEMKSLGKYGRMATRYLKENEPERYRSLMRFGKLAGKMKEVDGEANRLLDEIEESYLKKNRPKDSSSTMEMWKIREQARMQAEEIVLQQVVMKFH